MRKFELHHKSLSLDNKVTPSLGKRMAGQTVSSRSGSCISMYVFLTPSKWNTGGGSVLQILHDHISFRSYMIISTVGCLMVTCLVTCLCPAPHILGLQPPTRVHRHSGAPQENARGFLAAGMGAASSSHRHADCRHGERAGECPAASQNGHQVAYILLAGTLPSTIFEQASQNGARS